MKIYLNSQLTQVADHPTLQQVLTDLKYEGMHIAVAVNNEFIAKSAYDDTLLNECDRIDIVTPMCGG